MTRIWLVVRSKTDALDWTSTVDTEVRLVVSDTVPASELDRPFRVSPIFPLVNDYVLPNLTDDARLCFFAFDSAFSVLGRIASGDDPELVRRVFFTNGLASVVLLTSRPDDDPAALLATAGTTPTASEIWLVRKATVTSVDCRPPTPKSCALTQLAQYSALPVDIRASVDEFHASLALVLPKVAMHMPSEQPLFEALAILVNQLLEEMLYVMKPRGPAPVTLPAYSERALAEDALLRQTILQQNTDRLLQINSALSYMSTQALSGAIPIMERRSLIRRNSLLGIGTAVMALTRIASSIERTFAEAGLEHVLDKVASTAAALPGLERLPEYDSRRWSDYSLNEISDGSGRKPFPKLPFFSGRLGFRETEYTISAAVQALVSGATPEWSLLTISHEMLHGHVRNLLSYVFRKTPGETPQALRASFYDRFAAKVNRQPLTPHETLLDSIRCAIFAYCCFTNTHGSLTRPTPRPEGARKRPDGTVGFVSTFVVPPLEGLWLTAEHEYRNICEIIVHVLDLHYFYSSRRAVYIPLIWRSWATLPHVRGDLRQYLLRSLLVLTAQGHGSPFERFLIARSRLTELLGDIPVDDRLDSATILRARDYLQQPGSEQTLFPPFWASLILVDLTDQVLTSGVIRAGLMGGDENVTVVRGDEGTFEDLVEYAMADGFVDDVVKQPGAFLVDRLTRRLKDPAPDPEADAAMIMLACCSR